MVIPDDGLMSRIFQRTDGTNDIHLETCRVICLRSGQCLNYGSFIYFEKMMYNMCTYFFNIIKPKNNLISKNNIKTLNRNKIY